MTSHTYYIPIQNGFTDTSLVNVRKVAIGYMMAHRRSEEMSVYTSSSMGIEVGTIIRSPSARSLFVWRYPSRGRMIEAPVLADGNVCRRPSS